MMSVGNHALIGVEPEELLAHMATPALCIEYAVFGANLAAMAAHAGARLRPHVKAHKCSTIARAQMAHGARGLSCASIDEIEAMAAAGLGGLLLTAPTAALDTAMRLAAAARLVGRVLVAVDDALAIERLAAVGGDLTIVIDVNVGQDRTGVNTLAEAEALIDLAEDKGLAVAGVQAYYGHLQGLTDDAGRRNAAMASWPRIAAFADLCRDREIADPIVTGGGTGTAAIDLSGPFTEIQPGSYLFMDRAYGRLDTGLPLRQALTVASRVVSRRRPDRAILDAGTKALATDAGPAAVLGREGIVHAFMGDEHSVLTGASADLPPIDTIVPLVPPHCDPTVNLYDAFLVLEGRRLADIWPIDGRRSSRPTAGGRS
jgi:3-hydroxy-D-aspartate aldolase